jgi:hypothetical protein
VLVQLMLTPQPRPLIVYQRVGNQIDFGTREDVTHVRHLGYWGTRHSRR